jgi:P27 family predicted phage terminase small subunit
MARGRPPKSREQRIAEGKPGHRPLPEPLVGNGKVLVWPAPETLNDREREVWEVLVPEVAALGWVDQIDRATLTLLVQAIAVVELSREAIAAHGFMIEEERHGRDGIVIGSTFKVNPAVRAQIAATATAHRIAGAFGMTPSDRARLGLTVIKGRSLAAELAADLEGDDDDVIEVPDETMEAT